MASLPRLSPPMNDAPVDTNGSFSKSWSNHNQSIADQLALLVKMFDDLKTEADKSDALRAQFDALRGQPNCANDAQAAAAGIPVGHVYHNGSMLLIRFI